MSEPDYLLGLRHMTVTEAEPALLAMFQNLDARLSEAQAREAVLNEWHGELVRGEPKLSDAAHELLEKARKWDEVASTAEHPIPFSDLWRCERGHVYRKLDSTDCPYCGETIRALRAERDSYREDAEKWRAHVGVDCSRPLKLAALQRENAALREKLVKARSSFEIIRKNAKAEGYGWVEDDTIDALAKLGDDIPTIPPPDPNIRNWIAGTEPKGDLGASHMKPMTRERREELKQWVGIKYGEGGRLLREALASDAARAEQVRRLRRAASLMHLGYNDPSGNYCISGCNFCTLLSETAEAENGE